MKNNPISIDRARWLLEKYYEGVSSPAEEAALREFFSKADVASLPPDMSADCALFRAMGEVVADLPPMPTGLEDALDARIDSLAGEQGASWRSRNLIYWLSAAVAAAVIALVFSLPYLTSDGVSPMDSKQWMMARNDSVVLPVNVPEDIEEQGDLAQVQPAQVQSAAPEVRHPRKEILEKAPENVRAEAQDDFSMEITDPKAALTFARRSLSLVAMATKTATCHVSVVLEDR